MKFFNRFLPWVCFTAISFLFIMIIHHYGCILNDMPKWHVKNNFNHNGEISVPFFFFFFLCLYYIIPFVQISYLSLFNDNYYSDKISINFEFFGIRSLVMLFQAICLSIIYFIPLLTMSVDAAKITMATVGMLYAIWLAILGFSALEDSPFGVFWNAQDYIEDLNTNYYDDISIIENKLKAYLKNTQF